MLPRALRWTLATIGAVIAAALLATPFWPEGQEDFPTDSGHSVVSGAQGDDSMGPPQPQARESQRTAAFLAVVDAQSGLALPYPRFVERSKGRRRSIDVSSQDRVATGDADGRIDVVRLDAASSWLVDAPGYVPVAIDGWGPGSVVRLNRGRELRVRVVDDRQNPLPWATVLLAPENARVPFPAMVETSVALGDPASVAPIWVARTGADGQAGFAGLPDGVFRFEVRHRHYFSTTSAESELVKAGDSITVWMEPMFGLVVAPPPGLQLRSWSWEPGTRMRRDFPVQRALPWIREDLQRRFPGCAVYVGRPTNVPDSAEPTVRCEAILDGPAFGSVSWNLQPVAELSTPVFLELDLERQFRAVSIEIHGPGGEAIDLDVELVGDEGQTTHSGHTGIPFVLPVGRYKLIPRRSPEWVVEAFDDAFVDLTAEKPLHSVFTVDLDRSFRLLRIDLGWPTEDEVQPFVHLHLDSVDLGTGIGIMNRQPTSGPIECLVPTGEVELRIDAPAYLPTFKRVRVDAGATPLSVHLPLKLR